MELLHFGLQAQSIKTYECWQTSSPPHGGVPYAVKENDLKRSKTRREKEMDIGHSPQFQSLTPYYVHVLLCIQKVQSSL